ncbi:GNAT family N-acetyltransferase [Thalassospira marina]|uniref:GNAT family N-acetyltransferase n=1 Tax=Thalassospira marina TaxID=2048283 RepID=A0A2N3KZ13_9PROT|nr:N-acetyltransferase [Thalassospira marina]PKR55716.1 GNAT family N-acetyltransferase [Thalassospira marina]
MSTNLQITELLSPDISDFDRLVVILKEAFAFQDGIVNPPSSVSRVDSAELQWRFDRDTVLVARDVANNGFIIGQVWIEQGVDDAYFYKMSVDPACHGRGIGQALINAALDHVAKTGRLTKARLHVRKELAGNIAFFTRCGFAITGEGNHPGFDAPTYVIMTRDILPQETLSIA